MTKTQRKKIAYLKIRDFMNNGFIGLTDRYNEFVEDECSGDKEQANAVIAEMEKILVRFEKNHIYKKAVSK